MRISRHEQDQLYLFNLIDTPGHADFSYEVSRSMAACQGALLLVDAAKGVQAQTVANFWLAFEQDLAITPVINKVDLPHADIAGTLEQMRGAFDADSDDVLRISAKTGLNTEQLLPALIRRAPPPSAERSRPLRVLLFDSRHCEYRGVLCYVEVLDGALESGAALLSSASGKTYTVGAIELLRPLRPEPLDELGPGMVGCVALGMKSIAEAKIGDTLSAAHAPQPALPGFKTPVPMVFAGVYPADEAGYEALESAMARLLLQDASVSVQKEHSTTLGRGLRCGFHGLLHLEVVQQRLEEEHGVEARAHPSRRADRAGARGGAPMRRCW